MPTPASVAIVGCELVVTASGVPVWSLVMGAFAIAAASAATTGDEGNAVDADAADVVEAVDGGTNE